VIFRQFDGLGLGIEDHDAIIPAWSPHGSTDTVTANLAPLGLRPDHFDLQIIQGLPQVKTPVAAACAVLPNFFRFQTIGARLACWFGDGMGLPLPCLRR